MGVVDVESGLGFWKDCRRVQMLVAHLSNESISEPGLRATWHMLKGTCICRGVPLLRLDPMLFTLLNFEREEAAEPGGWAMAITF